MSDYEKQSLVFLSLIATGISYQLHPPTTGPLLEQHRELVLGWQGQLLKAIERLSEALGPDENA